MVLVGAEFLEGGRAYHLTSRSQKKNRQAWGGGGGGGGKGGS